MQPLPTTHLMMTWLSMCTASESTTPRQKVGHIAYTLAILILNLIGFITTLAYCLKYFSADFDGAMFAFLLACGEFGLIYFMIITFFMSDQIDSIFTSLSTIYIQHESEVSFRYLARASTTSEWLWTLYFKYTAVSVVSIAVTPLLSVLYCYSTQENCTTEDFYRTAKLVLPWNQTAYLGYFTEVCTCIEITYGYMILNGTHLLLFISLCIHHRAFYEMFKHSIDQSEQCDAKMLYDLIRFHISAKGWFLDSSKVYSSFVLVQLICSTVMVTISVFYLDLQWHNFDFAVATVVVTTSVGMSVLFCYCYYGKLATESYEMMSDRLIEMNWFEQPNELQKYFILMIQNMQKPLYYHGFEVAKLDLRIFIKLCNSVLSYYMVIKALASK